MFPSPVTLMDPFDQFIAGPYELAVAATLEQWRDFQAKINRGFSMVTEAEVIEMVKAVLGSNWGALMTTTGLELISRDRWSVLPMSQWSYLHHWRGEQRI